jgi:ribulose-bisphosphate carboxylase large chain
MVNLFRKEIDVNKYIIVDYYLSSKTTLRDACWNLAIGQSVGNPNVRNEWETDELFEHHSCIIMDEENKLDKKKYGRVKIGFPLVNINLKEDGISQLLCHIMGGQLDIGNIEKCIIEDIYFPSKALSYFKGPHYGIKGIRDYVEVYDKPILGGIIKPKVGVSPNVLLDMVKELVKGGVNFIKEDEIMANPICCPLKERVPLIMDYLHDKNIIYAVCINGDYPYIIERAEMVNHYGGNAVHINFWSGFGTYKSIRELNLPLFLFFQKSGDKILTYEKHDFHISWDVICKIAGIIGVDFIHAGMWGGYSHDKISILSKTLEILRENEVMPSLSCGMHAGLIKAINTRFGVDYMANVGGAIHGHPGGTKSGVLALRQAIDNDHGKEYEQSLDIWGLVK